MTAQKVGHAITALAPVNTVKGVNPSAGNVTIAIAIANITNLQSHLDRKVSTSSLKTINGQSLAGGGDLIVPRRLLSIPVANFSIGTSATANPVFATASDTFYLLPIRPTFSGQVFGFQHYCAHLDRNRIYG